MKGKALHITTIGTPEGVTGSLLKGTMLLLLAALSFYGITQAKGGKRKTVEARLTFDHRGLDGKMEVYEAARGAKMRIWTTGVVDDINELSLGEKVEDAFKVRRRGFKKLVLILRNPGQNTLYFFAPPHQVIPPEQGIGFAFKCLCVQRVFKVPPGKVWYRVIALRLFPKFRGGPVELRHSLVGLPRAEALRMMK